MDKRTLASIEEEFEVLKSLPLNEGIDILLLKQEQESECPSSEESSNSPVLEESNPKEQRRSSFQSLKPIHMESDSDDSDGGQRRGVGSRSRRVKNRQRN